MDADEAKLRAELAELRAAVNTLAADNDRLGAERDALLSICSLLLTPGSSRKGSTDDGR